MTYLIFGEETFELSTRERPSLTPLPDSRVESGWVVSMGASTSQASDTTHNSPPGFSWFAGGAPEPRVADYPSLPGVRRFPFRIG